MSKLARLVAQREGYGIPGAIPTTHLNPGDLLHSPHSQHVADAPDSVGKIDTAADGWADLERQLRLYAQRELTLEEMASDYWPEPANDTASCLEFICNGLPMPSTALVSAALEIA